MFGALLLVGLIASGARAAPGDPDPNFGGFGQTLLPLAAGNDAMAGAELGFDQKLILVGRRRVDGDDDLLVVRLDPDGTIDEGFGTAGVVVTDVANRDDAAEGVALDVSGFVVVAGWVQTSGNPNVVVVRYGGAGVPDAGFGAGGIVTTDVGGADDRAHAVVTRPDRRVLVAGESNGRLLLVQYDDLGAPDPTFGSAGIVTVAPVAGVERAWAAALQPDGKVVIAGEANGNVLVARFLVNGSPDPGFGSGGRVVRDVGGIDVATDVRVRADGAVVAGGSTTAGSGGDGFVLGLDGAGNPLPGFGASGLALSGLAGNDGLRAIDVAANGGIVGAGWTGAAGDDDVLVVRFTSVGALDGAFGSSGVVTRDFLGGDDSAVGMAVETSGRIVVGASATNGADDDPGAVRVLGDAPTLGEEFQVNTYTTDYQSDPSVAVDGMGRFVVVWSSYGGNGTDASDYGIHAQRYHADGEPNGAAFQVNSYTTGFQTMPSVAADAVGNFVVVWQSDMSPGADDSGSAILGRRFAADATPLGADFQVNTHTPGSQLYPRLASSASGEFVVVWESDSSAGTDSGTGSLSSIQGRFFASNGAPLGPGDIQLNTVTTAQQRAPVVAMIGSDAVVAWDSDTSPGDDLSPPAVVVRRFSSVGVPAGPEEQVNVHVTGAQAYPGVAMGSDGRFLVVWHGDGPEDDAISGFGTFGRRFAADGVPDGGQFLVNDQTVGEQVLAAVAYDSDHSFVVSWQGAGSEDAFGVFGRRFDSNGTPQGASFLINRHTDDAQRRAVIGQGVGGDFVVAWETFASADSDRSAGAIAAARFDGQTTFSTTSTLPGGSTTSTSSTIPAGTTTTTSLPGGTTTSTTMPTGTTTTSTTVPGGTTTTSTTIPGPPGVPLLGKKLILKMKPGDPSKVVLKAIAKDPVVGLGAGNGSLDDPVVYGGSVRVALSGGFDGDFGVPSDRWKYLKKPGQNRGYKAKKANTVTVVVLKPGKLLKVVAKGSALGFDLTTEPSAIDVVVRTGGQRHCMRFVGAHKFVSGRKVVSKTAERPAACLP